MRIAETVHAQLEPDIDRRLLHGPAVLNAQDWTELRDLRADHLQLCLSIQVSGAQPRVDREPFELIGDAGYFRRDAASGHVEAHVELIDHYGRALPDLQLQAARPYL